MVTTDPRCCPSIIVNFGPRALTTRVGAIELRVPQDRDGTFSTELFARYQRSEQALVATLMEMYPPQTSPAN